MNKMRRTLVFLFVISLGGIIMNTSSVEAKVINYEFNFTPFVGDLKKPDGVNVVPGKAHLFINNIPVVQQETRATKAMVLHNGEVSSAIFLPVNLLGPLLRKGKNMLRIEFEPTTPNTSYQGQLRWAKVTDQTTERSEGSALTATNQADEGKETKAATGKLVIQREFEAPFAMSQSWHAQLPVTSLDANDRKQLTDMVKNWAEAFKPDFAPLYSFLSSNPVGIDAPQIKRLQCFEKAYAAGIRMTLSATADQLEFITTQNPEVVIRSKKENLFFPKMPELSEKQKADQAMDCAMMALASIYKPQLFVVKMSGGGWKIIY